MRYFILLVCLSFFLAHCSISIVAPIEESAKIDELQSQYNHKMKKLNLNQPENKLYQLGLRLLNKDFDFLSAEKIFRHLLAINSDIPDYKYYAGRSVLYMAEYNYFPNTEIPYRIAYSYFDELVDDYPTNTNFLLMKSFASFRLAHVLKIKFGLNSEAIAGFSKTKDIIEEILKIDPKHPAALLTRAEIYYNSPTWLGGSKDMGFTIYKKIRKRDPDNMRACVLLARYYRDQGQLDKSIDFFNKALKIYQEGRGVLTTERYFMFTTLPRHLGSIYYRQKKYKKAFESTMLHLQRRPYSSPGYDQLADCYLKLGNKTKAIEALKKAIKYNDWDNGLKEKLKKLN